MSNIFFNYRLTPELYTLSLHDALPIYEPAGLRQLNSAGHSTAAGMAAALAALGGIELWLLARAGQRDRKSTRLNSSHVAISYAVFCLKKKKKKTHENPQAANPTSSTY